MKPVDKIACWMFILLAFIGAQFAGGMKGALAPAMMFVLTIADAIVTEIRAKEPNPPGKPEMMG